MNLNDYFDPVELDKPSIQLDIGDSAFYKNITINTSSHPITSIDNHHVVLFGIPEDRNALVTGSSKAPDRVRSKLYQLSYVKRKKSVVDLGNLKKGSGINDTYAGLKIVVDYFTGKDLIVVMIGGSHDLICGATRSYQGNGKKFNLTMIDSRLNIGGENTGFSSENFLREIIQYPNLNTYTHLGHQTYLVDENSADYLKSKLHHMVRLGELKSGLLNYEPYLRDSDILGLDICAVKHSDAHGQFYPSPNGLNSEEICQLAWYAGLADKLNIFGIYDINPDFDNNNQTSHLAAQVIWHFLDGYGQRLYEYPGQQDEFFKKFMINLEGQKKNVVFLKSLRSDRWWFEITDPQNGKKHYVPCTFEDYQQACKQELPERWWRAIQKLN